MGDVGEVLVHERVDGAEVLHAVVRPARELSPYAQDAERIDGHQGDVCFISKRDVGCHVEARYGVGEVASGEVKLYGIRA